MAVRCSYAAAAAGLNAKTALLGVTAYLEFFSGSMPATCETAETGTKLASLAMNATAFAAAADQDPGARAAANAVTPSAAAATGTVGYARLKTGNTGGATCVFQGTVVQTGTTGARPLCTVNSTSFTLGVTVQVNQLYLWEPEAYEEA